MPAGPSCSIRLARSGWRLVLPALEALAAARTECQVAQADERVQAAAEGLGAGPGVAPQQQRLRRLHRHRRGVRGLRARACAQHLARCEPGPQASTDAMRAAQAPRPADDPLSDLAGCRSRALHCKLGRAAVCRMGWQADTLSHADKTAHALVLAVRCHARPASCSLSGAGGQVGADLEGIPAGWGSGSRLRPAQQVQGASQPAARARRLRLRIRLAHCVRPRDCTVHELSLKETAWCRWLHQPCQAVQGLH